MQSTSGSSGTRSAQSVSVSLDDRTSWMRFVGAALVSRTRLSRKDLAARLGQPPSKVSYELLRRPNGPSPDFLRRLEAFISEHVPGELEVPRNIFELSAETSVNVAPNARVPGQWFEGLCEHRPRSAHEALVRGESLLRLVGSQIKAGRPGSSVIEERHLETEARDTIRDLLEVVGRSPTTGWTATLLLSRLFVVLPDLTAPELRDFYRESGVGFRCVRVAGGVLQLFREESPEYDGARAHAMEFLQWVSDSGEEESYRGRSFLVEGLRFSPKGSTLLDCVGLLRDRVKDDDAPTRERMYALWVLLDRRPDLAESMAADLESHDNGGLAFAAECVQETLKRGTYPALRWPPHRPEFGIVTDASGGLLRDGTVPSELRDGLRILARGAMLHIDGTDRRFLIDLIRRCDFGGATVRSCIAVLEHERTPEWLAEMASFVAGHLLALGGVEPLVKVATSDHGPEVRHAALWGLGEIAASASSDLDQVAPGATAAVAAGSTSKSREVRRAAAYTCTMVVTALRSRTVRGQLAKDRRAMQETLEHLEQDEDDLVRRLAGWGCRTLTARDDLPVPSVAAWDERRAR